MRDLSQLTISHKVKYHGFREHLAQRLTSCRERIHTAHAPDGFVADEVVSRLVEEIRLDVLNKDLVVFEQKHYGILLSVQLES